MKLVQTDLILPPIPTLYFDKSGRIKIHRSLVDACLPEIDHSKYEGDKKADTEYYVHFYVVESVAYRIALSIDTEKTNGLPLKTLNKELDGGSTYKVVWYTCKSKRTINYLTATLHWRLERPWFYKRIDYIEDIDGKRIVRMV